MPDEIAAEVTTETAEVTTVERDVPAADSVAKLEEAIRKERENTKNYKALQREADELRKFRDDRVKAEQTEAERVTARAKDLDDREKAATDRERRSAVRDDLNRVTDTQGYSLKASPATVLALLSLDRVEFDTAGAPTNLGDLLVELYKAEPALAAPKAKRPGPVDVSGDTEIKRPEPTLGMGRMKAGYDKNNERKRT